MSFVSEGSGAQLSLRISKKEGIPIHLVPEGSQDASVVGVKRVDELGFYNMGHRDLAEHVGLTTNKTSACIWFLQLKDNPDCC